MRRDLLFYALSWARRKPEHPVWSVDAAILLTASEENDEGKILTHTCSSRPLGTHTSLLIASDSRKFCPFFSALRHLIDKPDYANVNCIRYGYKMGRTDKTVQIPGKQNRSDPGTKTDSSLTSAQLNYM